MEPIQPNTGFVIIQDELTLADISFSDLSWAFNAKAFRNTTPDFIRRSIGEVELVAEGTDFVCTVLGVSNDLLCQEFADALSEVTESLVSIPSRNILSREGRQLLPLSRSRG